MKNVADIYPLSSVQLGMLFHTLAQSEAAEQTGVYVNQYTCRLSGTLRQDLFRRAWERTIERHPVLRTAFLWEGLDEPLQIVRQTVELPWQVLDWREVEEKVQATRLETFLKSDRTQGFDLAQAPALRLTLIQLAPDAFQLVWSSHHMLFDGWSLPLIWQDMLAYYDALLTETLPQLDPANPYRDYIAWQQAKASGEAADKAEKFWRSQLSGFTEPTSLPGARTVSVEAAQPYQQQEKRLDKDFTQHLGAVARQHRLTLNTLVQGAWTLLLHHYSGHQRVMYGSVVSGRPAELPGVEKMVGLFINTLPVCSVVEPDQPLVTWLAERQQQLLSLREYEASALTDIQRWSELPAGSALFESIVVFENYPAAAAPDLGFTVEQARYIEQSNYPLALLVVPGDSLELLLLYDTARFEEGAIARLLEHMVLLLKAFVEQPQAKLSELPRLTATERSALAACSPSKPDTKKALTIHQLIEVQAVKTPQAEAVVFEGQVLTYDELNRQANQLASLLRSHQVISGSRVALCLNRSLDMVVCILAVLKAGAAYVPLDPDYPQSRLAYCLKDTNPAVVLTERSVELPAVSVPLLYVDELCIDEPSFREQLLSWEECPQGEVGPQPEDLAYIIYTSGSTGRPKGVMVSHRNLVHSTQARFSVYAEPVGRFLLLSSIAFDSSVAGLFWTLCQGGTLVLSPQRIEQDLQQLAELITKERITHTLCVPTLYTLLIANVEVSLLATLRTVIVAGEACTQSLVKQHFENLPQTQLYNEYGPTEATVWCTAYQVPEKLPSGPVAIGTAIPNTQIVLVDKSLRPVPTGAVGEICVGGEGISQGYLNQPEKTAAVFFENGIWRRYFDERNAVDNVQRFYRTGDLGRFRADGVLEWLGRRDRQVKIRGYRIELGEIEEILREHPSVQEAIVVSRAVISSGDIDSSVEGLARSLTELSPEKAVALLSTAEQTADQIPTTGDA